MAPDLTLRLVAYLLVGSGIVALVLGGLLGPLGAGLVAAAVLASWWLERARQQGQIRPALSWGLLAVAALASALDLLYLAATVLDGMVHLLLVLILARLFMCRSLRDLRDVGFLSFFLLVATSTVTFSVGFLAVFVVFLLLGIWLLLLHHVLSETELAGRGPRPGIPFGALLRVGAGGAVATLLIAGAIFFVIPRVGQAMLPWRSQLTRMVTGFSDRVDLGSFGDIESDATVVMRVYVPEEVGDPTRLPGLRWRGVAFDRFDGRTWVASRPDRVSERRADNGLFPVAAPLGRGPILRQEIYLDPIGSDVVFAAPRPVRMTLRTSLLLLDDMGSVSVPAAAARLQYVVESELEPPVPAGTRVISAGATLGAAERARYLQLPRLGPPIPALAREVTEGSRDPWEAAARLTTFLSSPAFRYALAKPATARDPIEEFLLVGRSGNCEYFAAGLAVLLRTLGVPARVVGGFQRGEWNPYGRYFMVRLSDAHSWVEAHFDGLGWVTLDPSPRALGPDPGGPWATTMYLDAVRMRWYRYVINWSLQDQQGLARSLGRQARDLRVSLTWPSDLPARAWLLAPVMGLALLAALWAFRRGLIRYHPASAAPPVPRFYRRALRALARRGLTPEVWETARQFSARAGAALPAATGALNRLTRQYERARFGGARLPADEIDEAERLATQLETRP